MSFFLVNIKSDSLEKQFIISDDENDDFSQVSRKDIKELDIPKTIDMKIKSNLDDIT